MNSTMISALNDLSDLVTEYRVMLGELLDDVANHWKRFENSATAHEATPHLDALTHLAHRIAGSAGSFGFELVSDAALRLERQLRPMIEGPGHSDAGKAELAGLIIALLEAPQTAHDHADAILPSQSHSGTLTASARKPLFIVDPHCERALQTASQIAPFGYETRLFHTVEEALLAVSEALPCAIVTELEFPSGLLDGTKLASRLAGTIPVIIMSERTDFAARLAVARSGCTAYLPKPIETLDVVNWIDELTGLKPGPDLRVLVLDDDRLVAEHHGAILRAAGMKVEVLAEPTALLQALDHFAPDLVLMDMYMPGCTGIEMARIVRQNRQYLGMPIVFLSVESDLSRQFAALSPGADDFLTKPIRPEHLVQSVRARAVRARNLGQVMETDSLTGLLNHAHIKNRLWFEQSRVERTPSPLAFALVDLDHFKQVNDRQGHLAGDQVIRSLARLLSSRLRRTDIVGRYGGEEFAIVLPDTDLTEARTVLDDIRSTFKRIRHHGNDGEFHVTLSCGLALFDATMPGDGQILTADEALYRAKALGRDRVETAVQKSTLDESAF
ncbi:response regulator receiver modulated diguanylate cyclase [Azospirillum baldaniorum]|uniref:diguanylate cyclase n=1 Tax=Azospirillum baldaniorum TaxID=1064539 RepID=UPI0011A2E85B|nr:diguanylate cyclase [Azospirillum baldaniorum]TWA52903.1 response regulator receiver modulated diguanylate cyclase [Azospirillum baldaniorum]